MQMSDGIMFWGMHPVISRSSLWMRHFGSTNLKNEETYVKKLLENMFEKKLPILAYKIYDEEELGFSEIIYFNNYESFQEQY